MSTEPFLSPHEKLSDPLRTGIAEKHGETSGKGLDEVHGDGDGAPVQKHLDVMDEPPSDTPVVIQDKGCCSQTKMTLWEREKIIYIEWHNPRGWVLNAFNLIFLFTPILPTYFTTWNTDLEFVFWLVTSIVIVFFLMIMMFMNLRSRTRVDWNTGIVTREVERWFFITFVERCVGLAALSEETPGTLKLQWKSVTGFMYSNPVLQTISKKHADYQKLLKILAIIEDRALTGDRDPRALVPTPFCPENCPTGLGLRLDDPPPAENPDFEKPVVETHVTQLVNVVRVIVRIVVVALVFLNSFASEINTKPEPENQGNVAEAIEVTFGFMGVQLVLGYVTPRISCYIWMSRRQTPFWKIICFLYFSVLPTMSAFFVSSIAVKMLKPIAYFTQLSLEGSRTGDEAQAKVLMFTMFIFVLLAWAGLQLVSLHPWGLLDASVPGGLLLQMSYYTRAWRACAGSCLKGMKSTSNQGKQIGFLILLVFYLIPYGALLLIVLVGRACLVLFAVPTDDLVFLQFAAWRSPAVTKNFPSRFEMSVFKCALFGSFVAAVPYLGPYLYLSTIWLSRSAIFLMPPRVPGPIKQKVFQQLDREASGLQGMDVMYPRQLAIYNKERDGPEWQRWVWFVVTPFLLLLLIGFPCGYDFRHFQKITPEACHHHH